MTEIRVAKNIGFCFGVRRAIEMAEATREQHGKTVYTFGDIIHNGSVVAELAEKGIVPVNNLNELSEGSTLIIRSHGVPPSILCECAERGINVVDATCVFVKRIHETVSKYADEGCAIIITGKASHPEVIGIVGYCGQSALVVESANKIPELPELEKVCVVSQTTFNNDDFEAIANELKKRYPQAVIHNTICDTTRKRQEEVKTLCGKCDLMVVIGGSNSSNTQKLLDICKKNCKKCAAIENTRDFILDNNKDYDIIGIVAGASTPDRMIREVITRMNELVTTATEEKEILTAVSQTAANVAEEKNPNEGKNTDTVVEETNEKPQDETKPEGGNDNAEKHGDYSDKMPVSAEDIGDKSFEEALDETMVRIRGGQVLSGRVVQIADGEVCVNIGYKSDGIIPRQEFSEDPDIDPAETVSVGDTIKVEVLKVNDGEGNVLLSRKNVESREKMRAILEDESVKEKIFDAMGKMAIRGGLLVDINGLEAFVPASQLSARYVDKNSIAGYVNKPIKVKLIEIGKDQRRRRLVASARAAHLEIQQQERRRKREQLEVGTRVQGKVKTMTTFGAFVDIGGIEGLLHVTDMAWGRTRKPEDVFKVGQEIEVLILGVDVERDRISLGYKQLQPKPWASAGEKYPVGTIIEGKVIRMLSFGAFVEIEPTVDGLVHISEISERRVEKIEDVVKLGDEIRCKVIDIDTQAKRISLSRKAVILEENPEIAEEIERERAERERERAERIAKQRAQEQQRQERAAAKTEPLAPQRRERFERPQGERRSRRDRDEGSDYQLPPVEQATTSLAGLLKGFAAPAEEEAEVNKTPAEGVNAEPKEENAAETNEVSKE